jgi:hypothetical protein
MRIKEKISRNLINIKGFRTNRKIVVIESDDWGFQRIPSMQVFNNLSNKIQLDTFDKYDGLESETDLSLLFETLLKFKDFKGNSPVITPMVIMTNADFSKMKLNDFEKYEFETFTETFIKNKGSENCLKLYKEGIRNGVFAPQYHGREHYNISLWLEAYNKDFKNVRFFAENNSIPRTVEEDKRIYLTRSYNYSNDFEKKIALDSIADGINIFKKSFEFDPKVFMAPAYCWSDEIENVLEKNGVKFIQSGRVQFKPFYYNKDNEYIRHYTGETNNYNQIYTIRNAMFEPTLTKHSTNTVSNVLNEIKTAFFWKKPAIIQSHRINFIGSKDEKNRSNSILLLNELISKLLSMYKDVEFMSPYDLFKLIENESN